MTSGQPGDISSAKSSVEGWYSEIKNTPDGSGLVKNGDTILGVVGHYTQVVWTSSVRLGCGISGLPSGGTMVVCQYGPGGNYRNRYDTEVPCIRSASAD